jgi:N-acyl amino acid synthase of PEP-CTERM/exosortase system
MNNSENINNIVDKFEYYFSLKIANDITTLEKIYKLRYQVFCEEFKFEDENKFTNNLETDIYDNNSIHALLEHKQSGLSAGCVRVILPVSINTHNHPQIKLPFEHHCFDKFKPENLDSPNIKYGEASRLAVSKDFRRRFQDAKNYSGIKEPSIKEFKSNPDTAGSSRNGAHYIKDRQFPFVSIAMILTGAVISKLAELEYTYIMVEPKLAKAMSNYGIFFQQVGNIVDYHGQRAAFRIRVADIWETINPVLVGLLIYIESILDVGESLGAVRVS